MVKDTNLVKKKLESRVSVAGSDYESGMRNPSQDPVEAVLQKLDKLYRGLQEAIASGAIEAGLKKAKAEGKWQESIDKAVRRWLDARTEMAEEYAKAYEQILKPALETVTKEIEKMPDITLEQRIQKSVKFMQRMSEEIRKRKGLK